MPERVSRRVLTWCGLAIVLLTGGSACAQTGGSNDPAGSSFPTPSAEPQPRTPATGSATPAGSASAFVGTLSAVDCLRHRYRMTAFATTDPSSLGSERPYLSGTGGGIVISYTNRRLPDSANVETFYVLTGEPGRPLRVQTSSGAASLKVTGTLRGTFGLLGSTATIQQDRADGTAVLTRDGADQSTPLLRAGPAIAPIGPTRVACTSTKLVLTSDPLQFTFVRLT